VARITNDAIIAADGARHAVDTIVMATGFDVSRYLASVEVTGRDGRRLDEAWNDGAQAYLGITTAGFPNLFQIYGPNTNNGSILFMIECQVAYIMRQLQRMELEALAWMDVRPDVMAAYNTQIQEDASKVQVWWAGCANYYRAPSGRVVTQYPRNTGNYQRLTALPDPEAFQVHPAA
jgi:cation diffusion facilitator CzcD-associated flavoprotein CzcO